MLSTRHTPGVFLQQQRRTANGRAKNSIITIRGAHSSLNWTLPPSGEVTRGDSRDATLCDKRTPRSRMNERGAFRAVQRAHMISFSLTASLIIIFTAKEGDTDARFLARGEVTVGVLRRNRMKAETCMPRTAPR